MSCCFIGNDTNIQIICNYSAMMPYEFCVLGREIVSLSLGGLSILLIISKVSAFCTTFQISRTVGAWPGGRGARRNSTLLRHSKASNNKGFLGYLYVCLGVPLTDNPSNLSKTFKVIEENP